MQSSCKIIATSTIETYRHTREQGGAHKAPGMIAHIGATEFAVHVSPAFYTRYASTAITSETVRMRFCRPCSMYERRSGCVA